MAKKEYTDEQYVKFLSTPFNSNFGCTLEKCLDYFWNHPPEKLIAPTGENLTKDNLKNTYIPAVQRLLGENAYVIFIGILINENATMGWINYTPRNGTPMQDLQDDCQYILGLLSHNYPVNTSDPYGNIPSMPSASIDAANKVYVGLKNGDVGKYYMPATLAGNACVWANAWAQNYYFGNAYDTIIDMIKSMGGDPFGGGGTTDGDGTGGDEHPVDPDKPKIYTYKTLKPGVIYMTNTRYIKPNDDIVFTRNKDHLFVDYEVTEKDDTNTDDTQATDDKDNTPADDKVNKLITNLNKLNNTQFYYSNARPAQDPLKVGYTDCSGFVGWLLRDIYPTIWNNGYVNTGTIYANLKSLGCQVYFTSGGRNAIRNEFGAQLKKGDIVEMGDSPVFGAGNSMHVGVMVGDGVDAPFANQNGTDTNYTKSFKTTLAGYDYVGLNQPYWCVLRMK